LFTPENSLFPRRFGHGETRRGLTTVSFLDSRRRFNQYGAA
jgi:hypothetical protein